MGVGGVSSSVGTGIREASGNPEAWAPPPSVACARAPLASSIAVGDAMGSAVWHGACTR